MGTTLGLRAQGLALIRHTAHTELGLKHSHCKTHIKKPVNAQRPNRRPHCLSGPSALPASRPPPRTCLAQRQTTGRQRMEAAALWLPQRTGIGCSWLGAEGGRAVLTVTVQAALGGQGSAHALEKPRGAVLPSGTVVHPRDHLPLPGSPAPVPALFPTLPPKRPSLQSSSDPQALPSPRPTVAQISEEKRGPSKDDTEQTSQKTKIPDPRVHGTC